MEKNQNVAQCSKKGGEKNFMWSDRKDRFLVSFLADCAKFGEKHGKTFRKSTFTKAATAVSEQFNEVCTTTNVESRMKTVKKRYSNIKLLREKSGWSWDDELKMIVVEKSQALEFIEDNKYAKDLLNVPLEQYEELKLVCGNNQATGSYGKSFSDMPNDQCEDVGVEETSETQELSTGPTSESLIPKGGRGKRSRPWEDAFSKIDALSVQISRLTDAFVSSDQNFCDQVFGEVMKTEGFDEGILTKAFEYLTENPLKGRQFIAKRPNMRKDWMKAFATNS